MLTLILWMASKRCRARGGPAEIRNLKVALPGSEGAAFLGSVAMVMMVMVMGVVIDRR